MITGTIWLKKVVTLFDICGVAGQPFVAPVKSVNAARKFSGKTGQRNSPLVARQRNVGESTGSGSKIDIFLIGLPGNSRQRQG